MSRVLLLAIIFCLTWGLRQAQTGEPAPRKLPFVIEATDNASSRFPGVPRLHSFAWAQWEGKWIFVGGRTNGYHGVGPEADFPRSKANAKIWVVDPSKTPAVIYSIPVEMLPPSLTAVKDQWLSTNLLYFQSGDTLYLAGGYGQTATGDWVTHSTVSAIHLPTLIGAMQDGGKDLERSVAYAISPHVQSSGGELLQLDDGFFYLVGGHVFTGRYSDFETHQEKNTGKASQRYLGEIRKLSIARRNGTLEVSLIARYENPEFARRDLNVAFTVGPDGATLGAAAYGGVFTKDQLTFSKPIYWSANEPPQVYDRFDQKMSAYSCARMVLFDPVSKSLYTTFFGGISRWIWNYKIGAPELAPRVGDKSKAVYLDGLEWSDQISTVVRAPAETFEVVHADTRLPAHIGTNAVFLPLDGARRVRTGFDVFEMTSLRGKRTLIGYLYGGIRAFPREFPYHDDSPLYNSGNVPTKANDLILAVYITVPPKQ